MRVIIRELGHRFGPSAPWLFRHLTFEVADGSLVALLGPSGSGKSTLLSIISGAVTPVEGAVETRPNQLQWVLQSPVGSPERSALDHVRLPRLARGEDWTSAGDRARELLTLFRLDTVCESSFKSLSGGEAQRLMLARAIAAEPDLLLADEPTAQLDRATAETIADALRALRQTGVTLVIATHDEHLAEVCDRTVLLGAA